MASLLPGLVKGSLCVCLLRLPLSVPSLLTPWWRMTTQVKPNYCIHSKDDLEELRQRCWPNLGESKVLTEAEKKGVGVRSVPCVAVGDLILEGNAKNEDFGRTENKKGPFLTNYRGQGLLDTLQCNPVLLVMKYIKYFL